MLLAILLAAAAAGVSPPAEPTSLLAGCRASLRAEGSWRYRCERLDAAVVDRPGDSSDFIGGLAKGLADGLGEGSTWTSEVRRLRARQVEVRRVQDRQASRSSFLAVLDLPRGQRILTCQAPKDGEACLEVLEELARTPWQGSAVAGAEVEPPKALTLGGRAVEVPDGCQSTVLDVDSGTVDCPAAFASWFMLPDQALALRAVESTEALARQGELLPLAGARRDQVACLLLGREARCERLRALLDGRPYRSLWAAVPRDGKHLFAMCRAPDTSPMMPPCAWLFELPTDSGGGQP